MVLDGGASVGPALYAVGSCRATVAEVDLTDQFGAAKTRLVPTGLRWSVTRWGCASAEARRSRGGAASVVAACRQPRGAGSRRQPEPASQEKQVTLRDDHVSRLSWRTSDHDPFPLAARKFRLRRGAAVRIGTRPGA